MFMKIMLTDNPLQPASITESLFLSHYSIYFNLVHEKSIYDSVLSATNCYYREENEKVWYKKVGGGVRKRRLIFS